MKLRMCDGEKIERKAVRETYRTLSFSTDFCPNQEKTSSRSFSPIKLKTQRKYREREESNVLVPDTS